jgi:hypothetical protein
MIALNKLEAEGGPKESQIILGWEVDTRRLLIKLPSEKYKAWSNDLRQFQTQKRTKHSDLESMIGRLNTCIGIIPLSRFFLGDLRRHINRKFSKWRSIKFTQVELNVMELWQSFLSQARDGINMNLLSTRVPANITITDACPTGIGGFSIPSGRGWRFQFQETLYIQNNAIEFMASVVGIWIDIQNNAVPPMGSILAITDNKSCVCWLKKSSFDSATKPFESAVACHLALLVIHNKIQLHSQHLAGLRNKLADSLSRHFDLDIHDLTRLALSQYPDQVPATFRIYQVPPEVSSWICSMLMLLTPPSSNAPNPPTKRRTSFGTGGTNTYNASVSTPTPSSTTTPTLNAPQSEQGFYRRSDKDLSDPPNNRPLAAIIRQTFSDGLLGIPLDTWRRNSGVISGIARFTNSTDKTFLLTTSQDSSVPGQTATRL